MTESPPLHPGVETPPRDADQTRRAIIDATQRIISETGTTGVRVARVARAAGVTTGAIYGQFGSREGLLAAAQTEFMRDLMHRTSATVAAFADRPVNTTYHRQAWNAAMRAALTPEVRARLLRWASVAAESQHQESLARDVVPFEREMVENLVAVFVQGQADGWVRADVDARALAVISLGAVMGLNVTTPVFDDITDFDERVLKAWSFIAASFGGPAK